MPSVYDNDGKELYYLDSNGYYYDSYVAYTVLFNKWRTARSLVKMYADKVIKCHELERSTAVMAELFTSAKDSVGLSQRQLTAASAVTRAINETHMIGAADSIDSLNTSMDDEVTKCDEALAELEVVSEALKTAGEKYTELHNEAYGPYKTACRNIHKEVEDFTGGDA